jgi:hypothetical protein
MDNTKHEGLYRRFKNEGYDEERIELLVRCFSVVEIGQVDIEYLALAEFKGNI